jgi:L-fuculose-phosphate aldolase
MKSQPCPAFTKNDVEQRIIGELVRYGEWLTRRGYVVNTLGNIAVRGEHPRDPGMQVAYTKHMGVSLEEMTEENVVVTDLLRGELLFGTRPPSLGHQMNRAVFRLRPDVNAVIHVHVDDVIAYFSVTGERELRYVSADAALVLGRPVLVLDPNVNVERDALLLEQTAGGTNCIVMPNHGITTFGRTLSEAYHRTNSLVAEVRRIIKAMELSELTGRPLPWLPDAIVQQMYRDGESVIYGIG